MVLTSQQARNVAPASSPRPAAPGRRSPRLPLLLELLLPMLVGAPVVPSVRAAPTARPAGEQPSTTPPGQASAPPSQPGLVAAALRLALLTPSTALSAAGEHYWLVTASQPLRLRLEGPGTLTLMVRRNLRPHPADGTPPDVAELLVERLAGKGEPELLERIVVDRPPDARVRYVETDLFLPAEEAIFGLELPAGTAIYRIALENGGSLGAGVGLRYVPREEQLILAEPTESISLEELAGLDPALPAPPAPGLATSSGPPAAGEAATPPRSPAGSFSLAASAGAATSFTGSPGPSLLAGFAAQVPLGALFLKLGVEVLRMEHTGSTSSRSWGEEYPSRARYLAVPLWLGVRFLASSWRLQPCVEAGAGATWAREAVTSLYGLKARNELLLLLNLRLRGGLALRWGPGAAELQVGVTTHPVLLHGTPLADAPLGATIETLLGYRLDLL